MNSAGDPTIRALRDALNASPDNVPLRKLLGETLLNYGRHEEAEQELKQAVQRSPQDATLKLLLARAFTALQRYTTAIVVYEEVAKSEPGMMTPDVRVAMARCLFNGGELGRARSQYRLALDSDPHAADVSLGELLGITPSNCERDELSEQRLRSEDDTPAPIERPKISFKDVGGMERVKEEVRIKIIHPMRHPDLYKAYGKKAGGGILMYGPPGCGKTHIARATAGEVEARFICIGINDVLNMYIGESERNMHAIFEQARASAPCVLFFDEVDALGASRADMRGSAGRQTVGQFLNEFDGVNSSNEGVLVLAATNAPWHVDSAFRRPGRFDRVIFVPPPDASARCAILRIALAGKPVDGVDYEQVAKKAEGFSGADMTNLVDVTVEEKLRQAMKKGVPEPIRTADLLAALKALRPTTQEWFSTAKNYALYSNQGGMYDDVLQHMKLR